MKKLLITLVVTAMIGGVGYLGYQFYIQYEAQKLNQAVEVNQSTAGGATGPIVKDVLTRADSMETISKAVSRNPDTVAWLQIPGTSVNNPVLQSYNNTFYLRQNEDRKTDVYGCYFADYAASVGAREALSQNIVIYGHSDYKDNGSGPRFSQLFRFTQLDFAKKTPYLHLSTLDEEFVYEIFAVLYTDTEMDYLEPAYSGTEFESLIEEARRKSLFSYDEVEVKAGDKILTLSTCSHKYGVRDDIRFLVMGRLLPADGVRETEAVLELNIPEEPKSK